MPTICSEPPAACIRSRKGSVNWHVGQPALYSTTRTGPRASRSDRVCVAPSMPGSSKAGAAAPAASGFPARFPNIPLRLVLLALDEAENVEALDFAIREKAVDGVLLVDEDFENRVQLGQQQQLDIALVGIHQLQRATRFFERGETDHHAAQARGIDVFDMPQVEDDVVAPGRHGFTDLVAQPVGVAHGEAAFKGDNLYSVAVVLRDFQAHGKIL